MLEGLQKDTEKKEWWQDGIVDILMQKYSIVKEHRSFLDKLCREKAVIQRYV